MPTAENQLPIAAQSRLETRAAGWKFWGVIALLLAIHAGLALDAARRLSVTHDEYWHLPVGLLIYRTGRFDFDNINPPLARLWSALPLALSGSAAGDQQGAHDAFGYGDAFLRAHPEDYDRQFLLGRVMTVLLSVVTGIWLAAWSRELFGTRGGILTAALWAFCPNALANAGLVTPDAALTCAFIVTLHASWKFARQPTWRWGAWLGFCLGASQLVKFTALLLLPLVVVAWGSIRWLRKSDTVILPVHFAKGTALWVMVLTISLFTLNAGYLFRGTGDAIASQSFVSRSLSWFNTAPGWVRRLPVPIPRDFLVGLDHQRQIMEGEHPVYLDGEWRTTGFPLYYFYALAYKTSHNVQLLLVLALFAWLIPGRSSAPYPEALVWLSSIGLLLGVASTSGMQLGLRYILPVLPLLYLLAGQLPNWFTGKSGLFVRLLQGIAILAVVSLPLSVRIHPEFLAYFNELSGGVIEGRQHLLDSNLDWGQDLRALRDHLRTEKIDKIGLAYFGMVPPREYGIAYDLPPGHQPQPGRYAISANFVQGRPHTIRDPEGKIRSAGLDEFGYFRFFKPKVRIGASIDIYEISLADVQRFYIERQRLLP